MKKQLVKRFHEACSTYHLLEDGDHILVGLSGGKDSLLLLELLAEQARIHRPAIRVSAIHVRMANVNYESDTTYLQSFAARLGVTLYVETTSFDDSIPTKKPVCFLCSWHRRKVMFNKAQALGCNKIALGHHLDDVVHTALLNLFYQGQFAAMPALMKMRKMPLSIIRPLSMIEEETIRLYAEEAAYLPQRKQCPHEHISRRDSVRQLFSEIEKISPDVRHSILNALRSSDKMTEE